MGKDTQFIGGSDDEGEFDIEEMIQNSGIIPPALCDEMLIARGVPVFPVLPLFMEEVARCAYGENGDVAFHTRRRVSRGFHPSEEALDVLLRIGTGRLSSTHEEAARRLEADLRA